MSAPNDWKLTPGEQDRLTVLRQQDKAQRETEAKANNVPCLDRGIRAGEPPSLSLPGTELANLFVPPSHPTIGRCLPSLRTWEEGSRARRPKPLGHASLPQ